MKSKYNAIQTILLVSTMLFSVNCFARGTRCFLHGVIRPSAGNNEKVSLSNMIRMHFDADEREKCERMLQSYCLSHITGKQYTTDELVASFSLDVSKNDEITYRFGKDCKLISSED